MIRKEEMSVGMNRKITLKASRVNAGLTLKEASEKIGVTSQSLISWEHGTYGIKLGTACKLCRLYGCKLTDIDWPGVELDDVV